MKKLIVLVAALLLVSMVVVASDVTVGGKVSYRWMQDLANKNYYAQATKELVETKINATVDDYNTLAVTLRNAESGDFSASVHRANFTTDVGAIFGLPVGITLKTGFDEYKASPDKMFVTWGEYEDVLGTALKAWGQKVEIAAHEYVNLVGFWGYSSTFDGQNWGVGANGAVEMVTYELAYLGAGKEKADEGNLEVGLSFGQEVADGIEVAAAVGADYLMDADAYADADLGVPAEWVLGVGAEVTYNAMASLGLGWKSMEDYEVGTLQVDLWAMPVAEQPLEILAAIGLALDDEATGPDTELFNSLEVSLKYKLGAAEFYLGYFWVNKNTALLFTNVDGDDDSEYLQIAKEKAAANLRGNAIQDVALNDEAAGAVFMRMELAY
jgi:hypothetical protein